jgi:hypothetical protein
MTGTLKTSTKPRSRPLKLPQLPLHSRFAKAMKIRVSAPGTDTAAGAANSG